MYSIEEGRPENIECLLACHPNLYLKDAGGQTALLMARANQASNVVTPFSHEADADFWPHIVTMIENGKIGEQKQSILHSK